MKYKNYSSEDHPKQTLSAIDIRLSPQSKSFSFLKIRHVGHLFEVDPIASFDEDVFKGEDFPLFVFLVEYADGTCAMLVWEW
jgi:hypothetical protein